MFFNVNFKGMFTTVNTRTVYLYSIIVGALAGLGALAFDSLLSFGTHLTFGVLANLSIPSPGGEESSFAPPTGPGHRWVLVFLPAIGGLLSAMLSRTFAPEARGTGTDNYIDAFHNQGGQMRGRTPLIKSLATIATLASGGSAGKEGPTAQIGAGIGSMLGKYIKMGPRARRTLLVAGAAGGLGAIFRAPLGGALTAVEVLYKEDLETDALIPSLLSSVMAYTLFCSVKGFDRVFSFSAELFQHPIELIFYAVLGFLCSYVGLLFVRVFHGSRTFFFERLPIHPLLVAMLGGLTVGLIGFIFPEVLGQGLGYVQRAMDMKPAGATPGLVGTFLLLALLKILTTSLTISSGGSGGVFAPSLFIGGMLGGAVGTASHMLFPTLVPQVAPYIIVGMGGFFAGVANAPIASLLMVSELTGAYELTLPLMLVAMISLITSRKWSIYTTQVANKFMSNAHTWEMNPDLLKDLTISTVFKGTYHSKAIVPANLPMRQIEALASQLNESDLVVKDEHGALEGLISLKEVYNEIDLKLLHNVVVAHDLINRSAVSVTETDSLMDALEHFLTSEIDKVPVVRLEAGQKIVLGYIQYRDILQFYKHSRTSQPGNAQQVSPASTADSMQLPGTDQT